MQDFRKGRRRGFGRVEDVRGYNANICRVDELNSVLLVRDLDGVDPTKVEQASEMAFNIREDKLSDTELGIIRTLGSPLRFSEMNTEGSLLRSSELIVSSISSISSVFGTPEMAK